MKDAAAVEKEGRVNFEIVNQEHHYICGEIERLTERSKQMGELTHDLSRKRAELQSLYEQLTQ